MYWISLTIILITYSNILLTHSDTIEVYPSCNTLSDGLQYILPYNNFDIDKYPLLPVTCLSGNTILNPSLSFDSYKYYFTSLYKYDIGIAGPSLDDFSSWREWYLPDGDDDKLLYSYGVSEDCSSICKYDDTSTELSNTGYYMTGNFYLCAWITKGDCDMDAETYECFECTRHGGRSSDLLPGVCSHLEYNIDTIVHADHFQCTGNNDNVKPSIGLNNQYCVCYTPPSVADADVVSVTMDLDEYNDNLPVIDSNDITTDNDGDDTADDASTNVVYLSSDDFLYGTYRITESGTYIITENIEFNFNAPTAEDRLLDTFSPNSYNDLYWMPKTDGSQEDKYMGSSTWSGPYQLGFFSGITIETSNVIIDLNGFTVGMSKEFYIQQRFFSIIELAAKNFVSGQGPVDFGPELNAASSIVIKNGNLALTSHHCIHGNDAYDIEIDNIHAYDFDVAGIQLNGFNNIKITNSEIGPSSLPPLNGRYLHARTLLRRYAHLVDNYGDNELLFANRDTSHTIREYVDELVDEMDVMYYSIMEDTTYDVNDELYALSNKLFGNPSEYSHGDGGVVYGILLNSRGGAVMGFGNAPSKSTNAVIENVEIHDLNISPIEKLKFKTDPLGGATRGPVADVFDIIKASDQFDDIYSSKYIGTAYSDVQIAMSLYEESWYVLDHTCFDNGIIDWTVNGVLFDETTVYGGCNTDIQLHINKGVIGLRIDNIIGFDINNLNIHDLKNTGNLGFETSICGGYSQGNAHQDPLITEGYTGTEGYGITITQSTQGNIQNTNIQNIETYYGNCNGISLFKDSSVNFDNINIDNIIAGSQLSLTDLRPYQSYLPNKIPKACSIFNNNYNTEYTITNPDDANIIASNINGYLLCNQQDGNIIGECDDDTCIAQYTQEYFDELANQFSKVKHANEYIQFVTDNTNNNTKDSKSSKYDYKVWICAFILTSFICAFIIYYKSSLEVYKQILLKSLNDVDDDRNEYTPLLN